MSPGIGDGRWVIPNEPCPSRGFFIFSTDDLLVKNYIWSVILNKYYGFAILKKYRLPLKLIMRYTVFFILFLFTGCGNPDWTWYSLPQGVSTTWSGLAHEDPQVYQIWLNSESCAGHASREPEVMIVDGEFKCGPYDAIGCSSPEKNIMVITENASVDSASVIYHESFHLIEKTSDEELIKDMAEKCKVEHEKNI